MPQQHFLDWSHPLLPALTAWLLAPASGPAAPDLSSLAIIVPTAESGRRLRASLARAAGPSGLLSPHIITPEELITWSLPHGTPLAGRGELLAAWAAVLTNLSLPDWRDLFPIDPVHQDHAWATQSAADLLKLRRTLEEGARDFAAAATDLGPAHPEAARWQALARLEALATTRLQSAAWRDPSTVRRAAALAPLLPEGVNRLVLAGVPDSIRLVRLALESLEARAAANITVIIHAPLALADTFDPWGRPLPSLWNQRPIALPHGNRSITLLPRPQDQAAHLSQALLPSATSPGARAIGSADPEVSAPLRRLAAAQGLDVFDPEGLPLWEHEISWLFRTLTQLLRSGAWSAASQFLRVPDALRAAASAIGAASTLPVLEDWDHFQKDRLPQDLEQAAPLAEAWAAEMLAAHASRAAARARPDSPAAPPLPPRLPLLPATLTWLRQQLAALQSGPLPETLNAWLESLYRQRHFPSAAARQQFTAALAAWQEAIASVERGAAAFLPTLSAAAKLELAASLVRDAKLYRPHAPEAQALSGWLELPWQEAPHLVIAGLNEGLVPDSLQGDAWLPDQARALLDLKTNDSRLARDSYLLTAMIESRRRLGSLQLLAAQQNAAGDPLKPSRLLLRCPLAELPERALLLFPQAPSDHAARPPAPSWTRAWPLLVPPPPPNARVFSHLSVSALNDYLRCPFRFYLKHVLRMEEFDQSQAEWDASTFGNLFHDTLQSLHQNPSLRDSSDPITLTEFLHRSLHDRLAQRFGPRLTLPVEIQRDTLLSCLAKTAEIHAAERRAGWRFEQVEIDFPRLPGSDEPVRISGVELRGRIDLIERHPSLGLRILDYKTSSKPLTPLQAHLRKPSPSENDEPWRHSTAEGKRLTWHNLQLPLYAKIMSQHYREPVAVGYVNLPRALSEARLEPWTNLDQTLLDDAWTCAEGAIASIQAARFWPPSPQVKFDPFAALIFEDAPASFDPSLLCRAAALAASGQLPAGPSLP